MNDVCPVNGLYVYQFLFLDAEEERLGEYFLERPSPWKHDVACTCTVQSKLR